MIGQTNKQTNRDYNFINIDIKCTTDINGHTLYTVQDGDEGPGVLLGLDAGKSMEDYINLYFKEKDSDKEIQNNYL